MSLYVCDSCGFTESGVVFEPVTNPSERFDNGSVYTDCECPICGCLAYEYEPEKEVKPESPLSHVNDNASLEQAQAFVLDILDRTLSINLAKKKDKLKEITLQLAGYRNGEQAFLNRDKPQAPPKRNSLVNTTLQALVGFTTDEYIKKIVINITPSSLAVRVSINNNSWQRAYPSLSEFSDVKPNAIHAVMELFTITGIVIPKSSGDTDAQAALKQMEKLLPSVLRGNGTWYVEDNATFTVSDEETYSITLTNQE